MAEQFVLNFIEKLILLEKAAGHEVPYKIMSPLCSRLDDVVVIQKTARSIAESISLREFRFIIAFAKQKEKVGGHIDLGTKGEDVFIEIDPGATDSPESIGATLCHEISHKWLQVKGISSPITMDNEILTDITAVFLGFGKIMLNGCETVMVRREFGGNGERTVTQTRKTGYLSREQLAFVYRVVCAMRNVPQKEYLAGLSAPAEEAVADCDRSYGGHYDGRFHKAETIAAAVDRVRTQGKDQLRRVGLLNKHLEYVKQSFCLTTEGFIRGSHDRVEQIGRTLTTIVENGAHDPALRFLLAIRNEHELGQLSADVSRIGSGVDALLAESEIIARQLWRNQERFPRPASAMFNIIKCPRDGTKLRLPEDAADLVVVCPTCRYQFPYSTTSLSVDTQAMPNCSRAKGTIRMPSFVLRLWRRIMPG